jgi:Tol biopolymer transport system component
MLLFDRNNTSVDPAWLGDAEVMCMNSDGSGQVRLTTDTWGAVDTQPRWSANGARLAFNSDRVSAGDPDVFVGQANGCAGITQLNRITDSTGKDAAADWSPQ